MQNATRIHRANFRENDVSLVFHQISEDLMQQWGPSYSESEFDFAENSEGISEE